VGEGEKMKTFLLAALCLGALCVQGQSDRDLLRQRYGVNSSHPPTLARPWVPHAAKLVSTSIVEGTVVRWTAPSTVEINTSTGAVTVAAVESGPKAGDTVCWLVGWRSQGKGQLLSRVSTWTPQPQWRERPPSDRTVTPGRVQRTSAPPAVIIEHQPTTWETVQAILLMGLGILLTLVLIALAIITYFLPLIVAHRRKHPQTFRPDLHLCQQPYR